MGGHCGPPLVPQGHRQADGLFQAMGKGGVFFRPGAQGAVHVPGVAHHQLLGALPAGQSRQLLQNDLFLAAFDQKGLAGQKAGGIGQGHAGPNVAVINGHHAHGVHSLVCCFLVSYREGGLVVKVASRRRGGESFSEDFSLLPCNRRGIPL